jgi:hypothetical protein
MRNRRRSLGPVPRTDVDVVVLQYCDDRLGEFLDVIAVD